MKSVNHVTLIGNVTSNPQSRITPAGPVCTFGLATNRIWKDNHGEKQCLAGFHNIVASDSLAELCAGSVRKGKPLYVEGHLKTTSHDGAGHGRKYVTEIIAENIILLAAKTDSLPTA